MTPREESERMTRCKQRFQRRDRKHFAPRGADACLSLAQGTIKRVVLNDAHAQDDQACVQQIEVLSATVVQETVRLGTDTKHSEVRNFFSQPNDECISEKIRK